MAIEYYNKIARSYNELHGNEQTEKARTIRAQLQPNGLLLDVGAGTGIVTGEFKECTCIALDPSIEMLKQFNGMAVCGKAEHLPFKGNSFDCVVSITALHHANLKKSLAEIKRVARQSGKIGISFFKRAKNFVQAASMLKGFSRLEQKFDVIFLKK